MTWNIFHIPENNIIHIETEGEMTAKMVNGMVREAMEAGERHNSGLFLVDHRKVHIAMSVLDTFSRPSELDALSFPRNSRVAQLYAEKDHETFQFLETVSLNRGYQIRIFKDINLAREWLSS
jgi:hypothetical protein